MTLQRALWITVKLLTLVAFSTLVGTGKLPLFLSAIGFLALAAGFIAESRLGSTWAIFHIPRSAWNGMLIAACLAALTDAWFGSRNLLQAGLYVVVLLMANKLLTPARLKDVPQLFIIGFLQFLTAAVLTVDIWYAVAFVIYLLAAIWALLLYHLACEAVQKAGDGDETCLASAPVLLTARFFWTTNTIALLALMVSSSIFFIMPRTGFGFFQQAHGTPIRTSGFSEKVDLGVIGAVKQDPTLVMRVQFPESDTEPAGIYLRGAAFDHYSGQSWTNTLSRRRLLAKNEDGTFELGVRRSRARHARRVRQDILLEPLDIDVLFGLPFPEEIRGAFTSLETDGMDGIWLPHTIPGRLQYSVISVDAKLSNEDRGPDAVEYPAEIKERFLQLPAIDSRIAELARAAAGQAAGPHAMAVAIKQYLLTNYTYSLDVDSAVSADPLKDFLFTRKTGYCEHYATAMVVMLRSVGIPARLVTGFLPGEWNDFGHYYTVRQQDAHAWVEVWFPRSGWIIFDPTPGVQKDFSSPLLKQIGGLVDSIRLKWDRFIIHYSFHDQMAAAQDIKKHGESLRTRLSDTIGVLKKWYAAISDSIFVISPRTRLALAATILLLMAALPLVVARRRRHACSTPAAKDLAAIHLYQRMLTLLAARGLTKMPAATPLEFSAWIVQRSQSAGPIVQDLTTLYYRARFGHEPLSTEDHERAEDLLVILARGCD